jgi:glycosyltransferase involved in cell wall biosynthesis
MKGKILFFASDYKIGLSYLLTAELKSLVTILGNSLFAVAGETEQIEGLSKQIEANNIQIKRINGLDNHKNFFHLVKQICIILNEVEYSFIHVQNNWQLAIVSFIKVYYRKHFRIIYTVHGYRHNHRLRSLITRIILSVMLLFFAYKVLVPSSFLKRKFRLISYKIYPVLLGVEDSFFEFEKPNVIVSDINIVFAGQFRKGKNQDLIIRTFKKVCEKSKVNSKLFLPGEGPFLSESKQLVNDLGLIDKVVFPGNLNRADIISLYKKCHIAVIATNVETFGHCIAEPFVLGLCVISRRTGVAEDLITNGVNGFLFDKDEEFMILLTEILPDQNLIYNNGLAAYTSRDVLKWSNIVKTLVRAYE